MDDRRALEALAETRRDALRRIEAMSRQLNSITEASELTTHDDEHDPEGATIGFERAQAQSLLTAAHRDLRAVEQAARRIVDGTYRGCTRCGGTIPDARLVALPTATTCIACATRR